MSALSPRLLSGLLDRAVNGEPLSQSDIEALLTAREPALASLVFEASRTVREREFGRHVFLYGFVYFSTYCRNWCTFCYYRKGNALSPRYRKSLDEVLAISADLAASGVHLLDLTLGEDPVFHGDPSAADPAERAPHFDALVELVRAVKGAEGLPVMISPGVVPDEVMTELARAGADWYACYQETHNLSLYSKLRPRQDYTERAHARSAARLAGMLAEDGILLGVGETPADRAHSILEMRCEEVAQARVMGFVPQPGTPLASRPSPATLDEQLSIAAIRLTMPDRLIPASLDVEGIAGLEPRLEAGANVVTSIVPPSVGLGGVAQAELDIDAGLRTVAGVQEHLPSLGLEAASAEEYASWVQRAKQRWATASPAGAAAEAVASAGPVGGE